MKNRFSLILLTVLIVLSLNGLNNSVLAYAPQGLANTVVIDTNVLVVFAGVDNDTVRRLDLNETYVFSLTGTSTLRVHLDTRTLPQRLYVNVTGFVDRNSKPMGLSGFMREYLENYHPEWNISLGCYVRADIVEQYMYDIVEDAYNSSSYDYILFILYYPQDTCLRTYYIEKYFWEIHSTRNYTGLIAFGGNTPLFFIDFSAIPVTHPDRTQPLYGYGEPVSIQTFRPLWDIGSSSEKALFLKKYILDYLGFLVLRRLFSDRLQWSPQYVIDIRVIDYTNGSGYQRVMNVLNISVLRSYLHALVPYTNWSINTMRIYANNSSFFKILLENSTKRIEDNKTWIILDYINTIFLLSGHYHVISIKDNRTVIPVYIFVANKPIHFVFNNQLNFTGAAVPGIAVIVSYPGYYYRILEEGMGMVIAHEVGHLLGLTHPFEGYDPLTGNDTMIWLYDYIASPMSYAPTLAGWLGGIFVYDTKSLCRYQALDLLSTLQNNNEYNNLVDRALKELARDNCLGEEGALRLLLQAYLEKGKPTTSTTTTVTVTLTETTTTTSIETMTRTARETTTLTTTIENTITTTYTVTRTRTLLETETTTTTVVIEKTPIWAMYLIVVLLASLVACTVLTIRSKK